MENQKRKKLNKKIFHIICISVFAVGLLISGFSLAYFTSKDVVSNHTKASEIKVELLENDWFDSGIRDASALQPGMIIEKNPQAYNPSDTSLYIRMRFTIQDSDGNDLKKAENQIRYKAIASSLYMDSDCEDRFVTIASDGDETYNNPDFFYNEGWFYYYQGNEDDGTELKQLEQKTKSSELFKVLKVPVTKDAYITSNKFDTYFQIYVEVQGVPVNSIENTSLENIDAIAEIFDKQNE